MTLAALPVIWLTQDFAQLLMMGICIVPDLFLLSVLFMALAPGASRDRQTKLVWAAFLGGLIWDLRWTNLPGLSAAVGGGVIGLACFIWYKTPPQGRGTAVFTAIAAICELLYAGIHFFFWTIPSQTAIRQLMVQQLIAVPVIIFFSWLFWKVSPDNG
ncbi:MAG: hypothetical protein Q4D58_07520 [Synergistaceae bacterium]|nr:hypothetical protein [Synergistaceae bacterium]